MKFCMATIMERALTWPVMLPRVISGLRLAISQRRVSTCSRSRFRRRGPSASCWTSCCWTAARLERRGWVKAHWATSENNRRAKYYTLTLRGQKQLQMETATWRKLTSAVAHVLEMA